MVRDAEALWSWLVPAIGTALFVATPATAQSCRMDAADRAWIETALDHSRQAERDLLKLPAQSLPRILVIDATCTYERTPGPGGTISWQGTPHGQTVNLPGGNESPIGPISFATDGSGKTTPYFAMSLPSVWRKAGVTSGLGLERLMEGVLLHELMHTRQFYFVNPKLTALQKRWGFSEDTGDDSLQQKFEKDPDYVAAYQAERDTLFTAAAAPTDAGARELAGKALAMLRARRARWFTGSEAYWSTLDDTFLTMEGLGQWLAFAWLSSPAGGGTPRDVALREERRGGRWWTQDEGIALFLVVDRLVPGWQKLAFAREPAFAEALLARASAANANAN